MTQLRIMSFNVRVAAAKDDPNDWPSRADLNVRTIERLAPDLLGLQEAEAVQCEHYERHLAGYGLHRGVPYNDPARPAYAAIAYRRDRFEPVGEGGCWLSETPGEHSMGWDSACARSVTWLRLRDRRTGLGIVHVNTHLDHRGETARCEGAKLIIDRLSRELGDDEPIFVTGDFNCAPGSPAYGAFLEAGYIDAHLAAGAPDDERGHTFHGFTGVPSASHGRIDWILVRPNGAAARLSNAQVIRDAEPPLYPSDHYPVSVDVALGDGARG